MFNFKKELDGIAYEFRTMNIKKLQLFQVYIMPGGERKRFHMQREGDGDFRITDPMQVPDVTKSQEKALSDAIFEHAQSAKLH